MHGCEWDDETGEVTAFNQFGYDGQDFIALDPETMTWVAAKPQALITKHKWDRETIYLQIKKMFNTHLCPERLKRYLEYLQRFHQGTGRITGLNDFDIMLTYPSFFLISFLSLQYNHLCFFSRRLPPLQLAAMLQVSFQKKL